MADRKLCFLDASVLISAIRKPTVRTFARRMRAHKLLNDDEIEFVASDFLKLEVLPVAKFFAKTRELSFFDSFLVQLRIGHLPKS